MKILGIDLGYSKMGAVFFNNKKWDSLLCEVIQPKGQKKAVKEDKQRLFIKQYFRSDSKLLDLIYKAEFIVMEKPFSMRGNGVVLNELLGIMKYFMFIHDKDFITVSPMTLKKFATGSGKAEKSDMVLSAFKDYKFEASSEDEVDAFWAMQFGRCWHNQKGFSKARIDTTLNIKHKIK